MEEVGHVISVLEGAKKGLKVLDANILKDLSNQTIHSASCFQDSGSITLAVLIYSLSKLIERNDPQKIKNWSSFVKKFNSWIDLAVKALKDENFGKYEDYLQKARQSLGAVSPNFKPYIQEVMRKASINKASKLYEHGISMGRTAELLGITQWELSEYAGQKQLLDRDKSRVLSPKKRAEMALEFFS